MTTQTPNVVVSNPNVRRAANITLGVIGLLVGTAVVVDASTPAFDIVPGMEIPFHFQADIPGTYEVPCSELCGLGHHQMRTTLIVMPPADFDKWKQDQAYRGGWFIWRSQGIESNRDLRQ